MPSFLSEAQLIVWLGSFCYQVRVGGHPGFQALISLDLRLLGNDGGLLEKLTDLSVN